ncbi:DUF7281 domain-containing protein [Carboxylicivirga taeanensis]|uniref:DUF7281 domain-containing protein n=1 Tax=Carboxylicivirga taeanensis TaxID=1416875 RepID=UPI003F6E203B
MEIPISFIEKLITISRKEPVSIGQFKSKQNKDLLKIFLDENILHRSKRKNTFIVYTNNVEQLRNFIRERYGIINIEDYYQLLNKPVSTKSESAQIASNSKLKQTKVYSGFFVRTFADIEGSLNGEKIYLKTLKGSSLFISDFKNFAISENVTIVGIENPETFYRIENYKQYFDKIEPLFLLRFNNNAFIEWLQQIQNRYLHFGDFDLSGIAIYVLEYRNKMDFRRCSYFIPNNIEKIINDSKNYTDYVNQLNDPKIKGLNFDNYPEIKDLAKIINKYRKTIEQEALMNPNAS